MFYKDSKVEFVKVGENANRIKLSSIYPNNCSSQEYVIVDDEMLEYLIESEQKENNKERRFRRHYVALPEDETAAAKMGAITSSVEEKYFAESDEDEISRILEILSLLTACQRKRLYLRFKENLTYKAIGKMEGVGLTTVQSSCELALEKLKPYSDFLQNATTARWVDLL